MNILNILLMAPQAGGQGGGNSYISFLFFGGMILVMWLFMIRPQTKKAKLQKQFIDNLKEGDKIVTIAGIHGKVKKMNDNNTVVVEVSPGTNFTIERSAISMEYTQTQQKAAETK
ncbi:preprotein translocase subunit YajC [Chitinophaga nivalis]|uniref:Sec translocon accessory complex subunit YajC n=1 Tax=Chitinophaga nivalis TaxID=2991709 RepID=A0ABT3IPW4_9BACT|nr:preprotein translocase subunit YajC [Chitinophaga nivalis]MCW3464294.1 preprotein translocase subunit YajC [Chitinophaga nivalis]MCW3486015.1 preprotein translocase subunit YajC [Chitinophaga nivalis]